MGGGLHMAAQFDQGIEGLVADEPASPSERGQGLEDEGAGPTGVMAGMTELLLAVLPRGDRSHQSSNDTRVAGGTDRR